MRDNNLMKTNSQQTGVTWRFFWHTHGHHDTNTCRYLQHSCSMLTPRKVLAIASSTGQTAGRIVSVLLPLLPRTPRRTLLFVDCLDSLSLWTKCDTILPFSALSFSMIVIANMVKCSIVIWTQFVGSKKWQSYMIKSLHCHPFFVSLAVAKSLQP